MAATAAAEELWPAEDELLIQGLGFRGFPKVRGTFLRSLGFRGFPKIRGTFLGVPITRIIVFWGRY